MKTLEGLQRLLEPQERLDRLIGQTIRRFGRRCVDLAYANVHEGPDEEVLRALELSVRENRELAFQYTPYGGRTITRRLIAADLNREDGLPWTYRDVVMTPGAMAGLNVAFRALFGADDEVIVLTPCWQDYPLYLANLGIPMRPVASAPDKHLALSAIEGALGQRTRGVLLSQPSCPTGVLYGEGEIRELARLLGEAQARFGSRIYLISDEVHRRLVWSRASVHSPLASYPRSLCVYSFGKVLALQGQRTGFVAVSPRMPESHEVRMALERSVRLMGFCAPTALMQRVVCRLLDYRPRLDDLARQQEMVRTALTGYGYEVCKADATFFVYVRSPIADDFQFVERLAARGVLVVPSTLFHETGYFRISLTARPASVTAGLPEFARVLDAT